MADDDPHILRAVTRVLARHARVVCASTAEDVLALLRQGERFDMILLDLSLAPPSELMRRIGAIDPDQARRVVVHTGDARLLESAGSPPGAPPFLMKPASASEMVAMLARVLDAYGPALRRAA